MAKNIRMPGPAQSLIVVDAVVTEGPNGTSPVSGDPVLIGDMPGTAINDKDSVTGLTPVRIDAHIMEAVVKGIKSSGNAAIVAMNPVFMHTDGTLDGNSVGGVLFGYAWGNSLDPATNVLGADTRTGNLVASGATTTVIRILVKGLASADGTVTFAKAAVFVSTEQTGTGSAQNVAHGLGVAPTAVLVVPTDLAPATTGAYTVTEGTHTATNVVVTVTDSKKFKVLAWA